MPMIIPVVVALAAASTGVAVGFAAFAGIAGSMMVAMGTVMGSKDLVKIGAIVGVVGGIAGFANGASSAGAAASVDDAATAGNYVNSADAASDAASAANSADAVTGAATVAEGGTNMYAGAELATPPPSYGASIAEKAAAASTATPATTTTSLADMAAKSGLAAPDAGTAGMTPAQANYNQLEQTTQLPAGNGPLQEAAKGFSSDDLNAWWQKAKSAGKDVGKFIEDNKTLVKIGGDMLGSMYGPESEALDYQKSLMERARRNINAPVVLKYQPQRGQ